MNQTEAVKEYRRLSREDKESALPFFLDHVLEYAVEEYKKKVHALREDGVWNKEYQCLICVVGFSPEPIIQLIRAIEPKKVYMIASNESGEYLDIIYKHSGIDMQNFNVKKTDTGEPESVYQIIKQISSEELTEEEIHNTALDITGGKKSMISSATLAANYLNLDAVYTDFKKYDKLEGRPEPMNETPVLLKDPLEIFGDEEKKQAIERFNGKDFMMAAEMFQRIKERVLNPVEYEVREQISRGYHALSIMNFDEAYQYLHAAINKGKQLKELAPEILPLDVQLNLLNGLLDAPNDQSKKILNDPNLFWHFHAYIYTQAIYNFKQEKYDHTALFTYRCLEMMIQYRLLHHNIDASDASIESREDFEPIRDRVNEMGRDLYGEKMFRSFDEFGNKIALVTGLMILKAVEDPYFEKIKLERVKDFVDARNKSIFAHGFQKADKDEVYTFYKMVLNQISNAVWRHESGDLSDAIKGFNKFEDVIMALDYIEMKI